MLRPTTQLTAIYSPASQESLFGPGMFRISDLTRTRFKTRYANQAIVKVNSTNMAALRAELGLISSMVAVGEREAHWANRRPCAIYTSSYLYTSSS